MNQGRIWTVVSPNVGLPLFLGSVAVMSFTIHFAVLGSTSWMTDFYNGQLTKKAEMTSEVAPNVDVAAKPASAFVIDVAELPAVAGDETASIIVKVKPKAEAPDPS
jgi:light-harvesting protein B-800-850 alpha chain